MDSAAAISALVARALSPEPDSALAKWTRALIPYWVFVGTENTATPLFPWFY